MPTDPVKLHVCQITIGGSLHPCTKAKGALAKAGHDIPTHTFAKGRPLGIGTAGTRPELKALSGQEKLPVLEFSNGDTIAGSSEIAAWAKANPKG